MDGDPWSPPQRHHAGRLVHLLLDSGRVFMLLGAAHDASAPAPPASTRSSPSSSLAARRRGRNAVAGGPAVPRPGWLAAIGATASTSLRNLPELFPCLRCDRRCCSLLPAQARCYTPCLVDATCLRRTHTTTNAFLIKIQVKESVFSSSKNTSNQANRGARRRQGQRVCSRG